MAVQEAREPGSWHNGCGFAPVSLPSRVCDHVWQLDSYRLPSKLCGSDGKATDGIRGLYLTCDAKGILHSYHQAARSFSRRIVKVSHSVKPCTLNRGIFRPACRDLPYHHSHAIPYTYTYISSHPVAAIRLL